jgi:hypothetical protein
MADKGIKFGVFSYQGLSLSPSPADSVCDTLDEAFIEAADYVDSSSHVAIHYVKYDEKRADWYAISRGGSIRIENEDFDPHLI